MLTGYARDCSTSNSVCVWQSILLGRKYIWSDVSRAFGRFISPQPLLPQTRNQAPELTRSLTMSFPSGIWSKSSISNQTVWWFFILFSNPGLFEIKNVVGNTTSSSDISLCIHQYQVKHDARARGHVLWPNIFNAAWKIIYDETLVWYFSRVKICNPNSFWAPRTSQTKFEVIFVLFGQLFFPNREKFEMWFWAWRILKSIFLAETSFIRKVWTYIYWKKITQVSQTPK